MELAEHMALVPGKDHSLSIIESGDPMNPEIVWFKHDNEIPDAETVVPVDGHLLLGTRSLVTLEVGGSSRHVHYRAGSSTGSLHSPQWTLKRQYV